MASSFQRTRETEPHNFVERYASKTWEASRLISKVQRKTIYSRSHLCKNSST